MVCHRTSFGNDHFVIYPLYCYGSAGSVSDEQMKAPVDHHMHIIRTEKR